MKTIILILALISFGCGVGHCDEPKFHVGDRVRIKGMPKTVVVITEPGYCAVSLGADISGNIYSVTNELAQNSAQWEHMLEAE